MIFELETIYKKMNKPNKQISIHECVFSYFKNEILVYPFCKVERLEKKYQYIHSQKYLYLSWIERKIPNSIVKLILLKK